MSRKKIAVGLPSTSSLLEQMKTKRKRTIFGRIELVIFAIAGLIVLSVLIVAGLGYLGAMHESHARMAAAVLLLLLVVAFIVWAASQFVEMGLAIRAGFGPALDALDEAISREGLLIERLTRCQPSQLRERAKHLELKVKGLTKRAGLVTVLTAVGVVTINFYDAGEKALLWKGLEVAKLYVYAGSLGLLIGSIFVVTFANRLEQLAGILVIAADRKDLG